MGIIFSCSSTSFVQSEMRNCAVQKSSIEDASVKLQGKFTLSLHYIPLRTSCLRVHTTLTLTLTLILDSQVFYVQLLRKQWLFTVVGLQCFICGLFPYF